jgi:hypothetical protein
LARKLQYATGAHNMLTLHPNILVRGSTDTDDSVKGYRVEGMPYGRGARIGNFGNQEQTDWRILRTSFTTWLPREWTGSYQNADEALMVLQHEVDADTMAARFDPATKQKGTRPPG